MMRAVDNEDRREGADAIRWAGKGEDGFHGGVPSTSLCRAPATRCTLSCAIPDFPSTTYTSYVVPIAKARACKILAELDKAQTELVGKAVILTDGKAGTVDKVWLDEFHGLRISIRGHEGKWPVSTIKFAQG